MLKNPVHPAQLKGTVMPDAVTAVVRHCIHWNHRFQVRRIRYGQGMLGATRVRGSNGTDIAVTPSLLADPLGGIVAVVYVVAMRPPSALGGIAATHVLRNDHITPTDEVLHPLFGPTIATAILAVGRSLQNHGKLPGRRGAVNRGPMDIRRQPHSVAHRNHDIPAESDVVARLALGLRAGKVACSCQV